MAGTDPSSHTVVNRLSAGPVTHLRISGVIDETFSSAKFVKELQGHVILDLGRVERISSFGVRKWIEFTSRLPEGTSALYMINTPPLVVDQLNMVEGFAGVCQVLSVLAPYNCPKCGEDFVRLVELRTEGALLQDGKIPEHKCAVCGGALQFADLPDEFFDYARHQRLGPVDQSVQRYLNTLRPHEHLGEVVSHVKLVHDDITYFRVSNVLKADLNVRRMSAGLEGRVVYDLAMVTSVEPEAATKLIQIFDTASQHADVTLWRVPPPVLTALAKTRQPVKAGISTLYLPCECRNCGSTAPQRIEAAEYLDALAGGDIGERTCPICGGKARVPAMRDLVGFLTSTRLVAVHLEEFEALEPRALSQYLAGAAAHDQAASGDGNTVPPAGGGSGDSGSSLRLQVLKRLGQGGMAEVFLARQVGLKGFEKYVVIKKILENFASQQDFVEMLFAEARANARLTHQNIVQTFDVGLMNGVAYITMEYVRGPDVKKVTTLLKKAGEKMPIQHALRIVAETAAGLHYAHSYVDPTGTPHPMVHRDVSPHNILLSLDGAIKLSDFGIAKVQGEAENTRPGTFKGKIAYLSPEAIAGMQVDARSDVFALGVTLYELLTGRLPFRRENEAATLHAIMREPPVRPTKLDPAIPEDISDIVMRSLEKDPARRISSAGEMRDQLEQAMTRHRLNVSPTAVAQYFQERLGAQLSEYSPSAGSTGGTGAVSKTGDVTDPFAAARAGTPGPEQKRQTPAPPPRQMMTPRPVAAAPATPPPPPPPVAQAEPPRPPPAVPRAVPRAPSLSSADGAAVAVQPRTIPPPPATVPVAARAVAPALAPIHTPSEELEIAEAVEDTPPKPRPVQVAPPPPTRASPSRTAMVPPPAVAPRPSQSAPLAPPPAASEPAPKQKRSVAPIAIGVVALLAVVAGVVVMLHGGSHSEVTGLERGENLYLDGVRVDPSNVHLDGSTRVNVATAIDGKRHRLGNLPPGVTSINVTTLLEVPPPADTVGQLRISSDPAGCAVALNGQRVKDVTPTPVLDVEAGQETRIEVSCSGHAPVEKWVMGQDGSTIELNVKAP